MTTFETEFAASARGSLDGHFGSAVTYTPAGGSGSSITAILGDESLLDEFTEDEYWVHERACEVKASSVASPAPGDSVTSGTTVYMVVAVPFRDGESSIVTLRRRVLKARGAMRKE